MGTIERTRISRRAVLAGAGGAAGAVALVGVPEIARAESGGHATSGPAPEPASGYPPLAQTPGLEYLTVSDYAFLADSPSWDKTTTSTGAYTSAANGTLSAPILIPPASLVAELTASVTNTSGSSARVWIEEVKLAGPPHTNIGYVDVPTGGSDPQVVTASVGQLTSADRGYDIWLQTPTTGTIRILGARLGIFPPGYGFKPVAPIRVYDSRAGNPPNNVVKGQLSNGTRVINMFNGFVGLPPNVQGVLTNLTVVNTSASGFISLYKNGITWPGTSSINWFVAGEIVANTAYTDVDQYGQAVAKVPANASTDFFIDVVGYFT
ncbi:MAG: hypothetical protein R2726_03385 [Acidimicrobiales bacterium]